MEYIVQAQVQPRSRGEKMPENMDWNPRIDRNLSSDTCSDPTTFVCASKQCILQIALVQVNPSNARFPTKSYRNPKRSRPYPVHPHAHVPSHAEQPHASGVIKITNLGDRGG